MNVFEMEDATGKIIYLTKERWGHIVQRHTMLSNSLEAIKETIVNPLVIIEGNQNRRYYYRHYKNIISKEKYLVVVIKYLNGKGFIITGFYTERIE